METQAIDIMKQSREWCFTDLKVGQRVMIGEHPGRVQKITPLLVLIKTYDIEQLNYGNYILNNTTHF